MLITKEIVIDMGHRIPNHKSKCKSFHGHGYKIEVGVDGEVIDKKNSSDEGMVIDFSDLKQIMMEEIDSKFDHGFVMYDEDEFKIEFLKFKDKHNQKIIFVDFIPTVENLTKHWFELLEPRLKEKNIKLEYVKAWETPTSTALYKKC